MQPITNSDPNNHVIKVMINAWRKLYEEVLNGLLILSGAGGSEKPADFRLQLRSEE